MNNNTNIRISKSGLKKLSDTFLEIADDLKENKENYKILLNDLLVYFKSYEIEEYINGFYAYELDSLNVVSDYMKMYSNIIIKRLNSSVMLDNLANYSSMSKNELVEVNVAPDPVEYIKEFGDISINSTSTYVDYGKVNEIADNLANELNNTNQIFEKIVNLEKYIETKEVWDGPSCDNLIESLKNLISNFTDINIAISNRIFCLRMFNDNYQKLDESNTKNIDNTLIGWR